MTAKTTKSKRIIASLLAASLVLPNLPLAEIGSLTANAVEAAQAALPSENGVSEGLEFYSNGDGTCYVSGIGDFTGTDLVIPSTSPDGDSVTSIGWNAFSGCTSLASITIPDSVTEIGYSAFNGCTSLASITIPDSVTSIGGRAFDETAYYNDESNWKNDALYISNHLIEVKDTISGSYEIKEGTKTIAENAFYSCTSLASITIPASVTTIGYNAFYNCTSLESITIPDSVTSIGWGAFEDCTSLASITLGDSVTTIDVEAFRNCTSLASIAIPDSVTSIGGGAFYKCTSLASITLGDSVTSIGDSAFYKCTSLASITIGDSVTSIGSYAFSLCDNLKSITIPDSVTEIDYQAFPGNLENIKISENNPFYHSVGNCIIETKSKTLIFASYNSTIPDDGSVTSIGAFVFSGYDFTSITIPDGVTEIGYWAFEYCTNLKSITLPDSIAEIGYEAFYGCSSLESISIPEGVKFIDGGVFAGCNNLADITLPDSVTYICSDTFSSTAYYKNERNWEDGVLYISNHLIEAQDSVSGSYEIKAGTKSIAESAFDSCDNLTSVTIPDSLTSIAGYAFYGCENLANITIGDSVTYIGGYAFNYTADYNNEKNWEDGVLYLNNHLIEAKDSISGSYEIKEGTQTIAGSAFSSCTSLESITIPDSVTSIGASAFWGCTSLTSISIPNSVALIDNWAFDWCDNLTNIVILNPKCDISEYCYIPTDTTIYGYANSTAQAYAEENGNPFVVITTTLPGDVDGSGEFDLVDIILMQQYMSGWDVEIDLEAGDVDNDGETGLIDIILMQQYMSGWDVELI